MKLLDIETAGLSKRVLNFEREEKVRLKSVLEVGYIFLSMLNFVPVIQDITSSFRLSSIDLNLQERNPIMKQMRINCKKICKTRQGL